MRIIKPSKESVECLKISISRKHFLLAFIHLLAIPIEYPIDVLKIIKQKHKKAFHIAVSSIVVISGGYLATLNPSFIPHVIWDSAAYAIHGLGLAPIAKHLFNVIKVEI